MNTITHIETLSIRGGFNTAERTDNCFMPVFDTQSIGLNTQNTLRRKTPESTEHQLAFDIINPVFITFTNNVESQRNFNLSRNEEGMSLLRPQ